MPYKSGSVEAAKRNKARLKENLVAKTELLTEAARAYAFGCATLSDLESAACDYGRCANEYMGRELAEAGEECVP